MNKSCITFNSNKTTTDWAINSTSDPLYIVSMYMFPPFISYNDWYITEDITNVLYYAIYCGPIAVLLEIFANKW